MNIRLTAALLGSALLVSLSGCAPADHAAHPRLLANEAAQISRVDNVRTELGLPIDDAQWIMLERVACTREAEPSPTPRVVLEPVCDVSGIIDTAYRID